jgi:hypothetical protein
VSLTATERIAPADVAVADSGGSRGMRQVGPNGPLRTLSHDVSSAITGLTCGERGRFVVRWASALLALVLLMPGPVLAADPSPPAVEDTTIVEPSAEPVPVPTPERSAASAGAAVEEVEELVEVALDVTGPSPVASGPVAVSAAVVPNPGGGTIRFMPQGGVSWSEVPLGPDGSVEIELGTFYPSSQYFMFEFSGFGAYGSATDAFQFEVWNATSTTLATNRTSAVRGEQPVVLTAAVTSVPGELGGGTVSFDDVVGGVHVALGPVAVSAGSPVATFSSSSLRVGTHEIRATYSGQLDYMPSASEPVTVVVTADSSVNASFFASPTNFYPTVDGFRDTVKLGGTLNEKAGVLIRIYNSSGYLKRSFSLGTRSPGAYAVAWNGRTSTGAALPAGRYRAVATLKDAAGNIRVMAVFVNLSWRKATWKATTIVKYGDQLTYFVDTAGQGQVFYSPDYSRGRTLDAGPMVRDCTDCGVAFGEATFALASAGLDYRYLYLEVHGHGYDDREHTGTLYLVNPKTGDLGIQMTLPDYDEAGVTYGMSVTKGYISATKRIKAVVWMTQAWGDAFDLHYLKLRYQYAVLL